MKSILFIFLLTSSVYASAVETSVTAPNPCDVKKEEIRKDLEQAKLHKNAAQISGLEKALAEASKNCTPESLAAKHNEKVTKLEAKVNERMADLQKAEASGKSKKIEKAKKKLQETEQELQAAKK